MSPAAWPAGRARVFPVPSSDAGCYLGRRWPLILVLAGAAGGFALVSSALRRAGGAGGPIALAGVTLGYACRALGIGPLPQVVGSETMPLHLLARGKAASTMLRRFCAMAYCLLLPPILAVVGGAAVFRTQAVAAAAAAFYVWLRLPETRGFEAAEIDAILSSVDWVPFAAAPPPPTQADELREQASRLAARRSAAAPGVAADDDDSERELYDVWGGRGAYRG